MLQAAILQARVLSYEGRQQRQEPVSDEMIGIVLGHCVMWNASRCAHPVLESIRFFLDSK